MPTVTVSSKLPTGRWRAGKKWTAEAQTAEVSADDLRTLKADPYLDVKESAASPEKLNAKEMIAKVMTITDPAELKKIRKDEERSTVLEAIDAQLEALKK